MKLKVLIVDDSAVYRSQIRASLDGHPDIEVVGQAPNGKLALDFLKSRDADVITLDLEMPVMDGLQTLAELKRAQSRARVIAFSSHTKSGAESTMAALTSGASDFLAKPKADASAGQTPAELIRGLLLPKILQFKTDAGSAGAVPTSSPRPVVSAPLAVMPAADLSRFMPKVLTIASSTGGPAALEKLFSLLQGPIHCPILIAQHMPPLFTATLAERLAKISGLDVREARHGEALTQNMVRIAPGDFHLRLGVMNDRVVTLLDQDPQRNSVRPAADYLLESAAKLFGRNCLGMVLTGMGADGKDGAVAIKNSGGAVLIQNRESCVVFGMPGAVSEAKAFDAALDIEGLAKALADVGVVQSAKAA